VLEVTYTTTIDDYVRYAFHLRRKPVARTLYLFAWLFIPVVSLLWALVPPADHPEHSLYAGVLGLSYLVLYPLWRWVSIRSFAKKLEAEGVVGRITLTLDDKTLTEQTSKEKSVATWREMHGVEVVDDVTYIYVTTLLTAIIPRHCFERPEDYDAVRHFALVKLKRVQGPFTLEEKWP
jgi:hypothetical protein